MFLQDKDRKAEILRTLRNFCDGCLFYLDIEVSGLLSSEKAFLVSKEIQTHHMDLYIWQVKHSVLPLPGGSIEFYRWM